MRNLFLFLLITFYASATAIAQVKIGENPQNIDPSSVLELESTDKVLVITRVTTAQMNAIVPSQGALCFNTDLQSVHYYNGTQWVNLGGGGTGTGGPLTADPIVNPQSTIVITPTATGDNLEVAPNSIRGQQIENFSITGEDIQNGSIGPGKIQNNSVTEEKLSDNIDISVFRNDVGYITAGDIDVVSNDAGNVISTGTDGRAFYDDSNLQMDIMDNADAIMDNANTIMLDNDQSPTNERQNLIYNATTNILTITTPATTGNQVDLSALGGGGGSTEVADLTTITGIGTAGDPFKIEPAGTVGRFLQTDTAGDVVWADLPTGTGGTVDVDGATIVGTGAAALPLRVPAGGISNTEIANSTILGEDLNQMMAMDGQVLAWDDTAANWVPSDLSGTGGNNTLMEVTMDSLVIQDAGGRLGVLLSDLPASGSNNNLVEVTMDSLVIQDAGGRLGVLLSDLPASGSNNNLVEVTMDSLVIQDAGGRLGVLLSDLPGGSDNTLFNVANDSLRITDGDGTLSVPLDTLAHTGNPKAIFYAGPDGKPTTADDNGNADDDLGFFWDSEARALGIQSFGALFVGLQAGNAQSNVAKVHIADNFPGLGYALQLQNHSAAFQGRATGILFSTETVGSHGKGALVFERKSGNANGLGSFHFLQNNMNDATVPALADSVVTIRQTGDLALHRNLIARNGAGSNGQVLTTNVAGETVWGTGGGIGTLLENNILLGDNMMTAQKVALNTVPLSGLGAAQDSISMGDFRIFDLEDPVDDQDAATKKYVDDNAGNIGTLNENNILLGDNTMTAQKVPLSTVALSALGAAAADVSMGTSFQITNLADPTANQDAATKKYVDDNVTKGTAAGSVFFAGVAPNFDPTENTAQLVWDNINNRLNIGAVFVDNDHKLNVNGVMRTTGIKVSNGTEGVPSYRFTNNGDTGMFLADAGGELGFSANNLEAMRIDQNQNVGIGLMGPLSKLHVAGDIRADGNFISANTTIQLPDYVFETYYLGHSKLDESYHFQSLEEIEAFLKEKNHLPGIQSAKEVKEAGKWDLTKSSFNNLEKIEELFLHTIEQENKIKSLKSDNDSLKTEIDLLKNDLKEIKKLLQDK